MEEYYQSIIITKNIPLFKEKIENNLHKNFYKYTSEKYYNYIYSLLSTLCNNYSYQNKDSIFYTSLNYILKVLYKYENISYQFNIDLIVLNCFTLGIKSLTKQELHPTIKKLKNCYFKKYMNYPKKQICKGEILCLKLLDYNINILTSYDYIIYLSKNDLKLRKLSIKNLDYLVKKDLKKYLYELPFDIAKECLNTIKEKIIYKEPKIIHKKIIGSRSPIINKNYSVEDEFFKNNFQNNDLINDKKNSLKIRVRKVTFLNKMKKNLTKSEQLNLLINNIKINNSINEKNKIYKKKNCNDNLNYSILVKNIQDKNNIGLFNKIQKINSYSKYVYNNSSKGKIKCYINNHNRNNKIQLINSKSTLNMGKENNNNLININFNKKEDNDFNFKGLNIDYSTNKDINSQYLNKTIKSSYIKNNLETIKKENYDSLNISKKKYINFSNKENIPLNKSINFNIENVLIKW